MFPFSCSAFYSIGYNVQPMLRNLVIGHPASTYDVRNKPPWDSYASHVAVSFGGFVHTRGWQFLCASLCHLDHFCSEQVHSTTQTGRAKRERWWPGGAWRREDKPQPKRQTSFLLILLFHMFYLFSFLFHFYLFIYTYFTSRLSSDISISFYFFSFLFSGFWTKYEEVLEVGI